MRFSFKSEGNRNDTKTKMDEIEKLARVIEDGKAKKIIVLCGAGVSTGKFLAQKIRVFGNKSWNLIVFSCCVDAS